MTASPASRVVRLSHVCLNSGNLEKTEAFYCGILEFKKIHEFMNPAGERYGFILSSGSGTFVEFFRRPPATETVQGDRNFRHLCFQVSDIQSVAEVFKKNGIEVLITVGRTDGVPQFWVSDPDGTAVEFHEYSNPESPQSAHV